MHKQKFIAALALSAISLAAHAGGPEDYVKVPSITYGEQEFEFKYGTSKLPDGGGRESAGSFGYGYGITSWWFTEFYPKYKKEADDRLRYDSIEWENVFAFTEPGQYPVDVGAFIEIEKPRASIEGWEFRFGPLLQTEFGRVQVNANVFLKRNVRVGADSDPQVTEMHYQAQVKYRLSEGFEYGVQAFGELGKWNHWDPRKEQNHRIGPAIFGKIPMGGGQAVKYDVAWLLGASKAAPDNTFRMQMEYEF